MPYSVPVFFSTYIGTFKYLWKSDFQKKYLWKSTTFSIGTIFGSKIDHNPVINHQKMKGNPFVEHYILKKFRCAAVLMIKQCHNKIPLHLWWDVLELFVNKIPPEGREIFWDKKVPVQKGEKNTALTLRQW